MVVSNFTQKWTLAYFSKNDPWAPRSCSRGGGGGWGIINWAILTIIIRHGGVKFYKKMNFGLLFQKWSLGTQKLFCKVLEQLDTQLNNYGLISRHTSINCVNNCTFIFTRHQPRLFLKALLVWNTIRIKSTVYPGLYTYIYTDWHATTL